MASATPPQRNEASHSPLGDPEKGEPVITVRASDSQEPIGEKPGVVTWETGVWPRFPWIGFGAIMVMITGMILTAIVLLTSDGKSREQWPAYEKWKWKHESWRSMSQIEPHVILAIISTITNVALAIAIGQGVAIAWWRRAMKGSTVEDLHRSWSFAASVLDLLTAGKKFNYIALAALMAKVALVDNVLLQKAAGTYPEWYLVPNASVTLPMNVELPPNYAGYVSSDGQTVSASSSFSSDIMDYLKSSVVDVSTIYANSTTDDTFGYNTQCQGICYGSFPGFGFEWDCTDIENSTQYIVTPELALANTQSTLTAAEAVLNSTSNLNTTGTTSADELLALQINPLLSVSANFIPPGVNISSVNWALNTPLKSVFNKTYDYGSIAMQVKYASLSAKNGNASVCTGVTQQRFCSLRPAIINYPLKIVNVTNPGKGASVSDMENGIFLWANWNATYKSIITGKTINNTDIDTSEEGLADGQFNGNQISGYAYTPYDPKWNTNLQMIANFINSNWGAYVIMQTIQSQNGATRWYALNPNAGAALDMPRSLFGSWWPQYDPSVNCTLEVTEPVYEMGYGLNLLMLRSSMRAATVQDPNSPFAEMPIDSLIQTSSYRVWLSSIFYNSNWWFGGAAIITVFFCILCVLPSYWGFWELGRQVTLGPMEIANAFRAPVLDHPSVATSGEVKKLVKEIGSREVRYGEVEGQNCLGVAGPSEIKPLPTR